VFFLAILVSFCADAILPKQMRKIIRIEFLMFFIRALYSKALQVVVVVGGVSVP
jgi:hypothetical protein